jgi:hypothetical protein
VEGIADDTTLGAAVGVGDVISTDDLGTKKVQRVKVQHGADGSATDASTASPLPVDQTNTTVADGGALPAKGVQVGGTDGSVFQVLSTDAAGRLNTNVNGTVPVSIAATQAVNAAQVAGTTTDTNSGVKSAGTQRVVLATDQPQLTNALKVDGSAVTQPVSGTVTSTLSATTNAGATAKTSDYDTGAGTDTVTGFGIALPASGGAVQGGTATNPVRTDPTGTTTQPVSGTVTASGPLTDTQLRASAVPVSLASAPSTAVTNAGTFAVQIAANSSINNAQVSGTAVSVNSGAKDAGTQRVILASDQTVVPVSDNSGSLTVDAPVATPVFVRLSDGSAAITTLAVSLATLPALTAGAAQIGTVGVTPQTSGGFATPFHLHRAGSTNATNVKASAGQLFGWYIRNFSTGTGRSRSTTRQAPRPPARRRLHDEHPGRRRGERIQRHRHPVLDRDRDHDRDRGR